MKMKRQSKGIRKSSRRSKPKSNASKIRRTPAAVPKKRLPKYEKLTASKKGIYDRITNLTTDLRGGKGTWPELLRKYRLTARTARKYGGRDLLGGGRGKPVRASKADRRVRDLLFPMPTGDVPIRTRSSRDATKLSDYYNDREKLLRGTLSAAKFEAKWRGERIAGNEFFADAGTILEMADADVLKMEKLYASVGGEQ
jgi:hypothetical protein